MAHQQLGYQPQMAFVITEVESGLKELGNDHSKDHYRGRLLVGRAR